MKKCPQCGWPMIGGAPHDENDAGQLECHHCGFIERVPAARNVHLETVEAGLCPGGVWIRICGATELIVAEMLSAEMAGHLDQLAGVHADRVGPYLERGETVRCYFYDGDTGECMGTIITTPKGD